TIARASTRVDALRQDLRTLAARELEAQEVRETTQEQVAQLQELAQNERDTLEGTEMLLDDHRLQLQEMTQSERRLRETHEEAQETLQKLQNERRQTEAALQSVQHILSTGVGLAQGARSILHEANAQSIPGVLGPIAARWRTSDDADAHLATLLGPWMGAILVDRPHTALRLLNIAKMNGHGVAILSLTDPMEGHTTPWLEALAPIPRSIATLAQRTARVDTLDGTEQDATVDDQRFWSDGEGRFVFRAETMAAEQLLKTQRERDILNERLEIVEEDEVDAEDAVLESKEAWETLQAARQEQQERTEILEDTVRRARLDLEEHLSRAQNAERHLRRLEQEHQEAEQRIQAVRADIEKSQQESQRAQEERDALIADLAETKTAFETAESE